MAQTQRQFQDPVGHWSHEFKPSYEIQCPFCCSQKVKEKLTETVLDDFFKCEDCLSEYLIDLDTNKLIRRKLKVSIGLHPSLFEQLERNPDLKDELYNRLEVAWTGK